MIYKTEISNIVSNSKQALKVYLELNGTEVDYEIRFLA